MSAFRGFSETQIRHGEEEEESIPKQGISKKASPKSRASLVRKTKGAAAAAASSEKVPYVDIPPDLARLSVTSTKTSPTRSSPKSENEQDDTTATNPDIIKGLSQSADAAPVALAKATADPSKADLMQKRQKEMEGENNRKRALLTKEIADRRQRTAVEAKHLQQVQVELQRMDLLVVDDINILRKTIEDASIEFMEAQKRYDRAEKEYVDSKLQLYNKQDRKELLTEHLSAIIEHSEMRKAKKLTELMNQLQIIENCDSNSVKTTTTETNGAQ
jgi:hypothetical protein